MCVFVSEKNCGRITTDAKQITLFIIMCEEMIMQYPLSGSTDNLEMQKQQYSKYLHLQ